jgi:xylan 1,4-beta-xylosidase
MQEPVNVDLLVKGIEASTVKLDQYRIDKEHSNSYQLWMQMGSPQDVTAEKYAQLELSGKQHQVNSTPSKAVVGGALSIPVNMESQSVSLFVINGQ